MANSACVTKQTFCLINGQLVKDNPGIGLSISDDVQYDDITDTYFTNLKAEIKKIYDYGELGTPDPAYTNIFTAQDQALINQDDFNTFLSVLKASNSLLENNPTISKQIITNLLSTINNYQINDDRCNDCNTAANCGQGSGGGCNNWDCTNVCQGGNCTLCIICEQNS